MLNTKEFYDVMSQFEKHWLVYGKRMDREDKELWTKQRYYQDGTVNQMFCCFLSGYALGKSV